MTCSWSSAGVPRRIPRSINHRPSVENPPIIGTSKKVTSGLEPTVARYQLSHASTGNRDWYVNPSATSAILPDDAPGSSASPPDRNCPLRSGGRSKCGHRHDEYSDEICAGGDAGHGVQKRQSNPRIGNTPCCPPNCWVFVRRFQV